MEQNTVASRMLGGLANMISGLGLVFVGLNLFGGVIAGIWLAILGEWGAIGLGIIGIFVSHILISIALMPNFVIGAGASVAMKRGSRLGTIFLGLLSNLYIAAVFVAWCMGILLLFVYMADANSWIPMLLWSYGVALGPWQFLASKDAQAGTGEGSTITTFFGQLAYVIAVAVGVITGASFVTMVIVFGSVMLLNVLIQTLSVIVSSGAPSG